MNWKVFALIAAALIGIGVLLYVITRPPKEEGCAIAPPKDYEGNREVALKVAADLSKLTELPVSGDVQATAKNTAKQTFQLLPDTDVACHMLLQTITCLSKKPGNEATVQSLLAYIRDGDKCGNQPPPKNAYQARIQGQTSVVNGDRLELELGFVEAGKELTIPIEVIVRLPRNPQLQITRAEAPVAAKWESGMQTAVATDQTPAVVVLTVPAQEPNTELRREVRIAPVANKPLPPMILAVHVHSLPATQVVTRSSGSKRSGRGKDYSDVYTVCAQAPTPGEYVHESDRFWLTGDRNCGSWAHCDRRIDPSNKQVCLHFSLQGHDECLRPFADCDATRDSEGHVQATFRLAPSAPSLRVVGS
jgi:hypothetical protein